MSKIIIEFNGAEAVDLWIALIERRVTIQKEIDKAPTQDDRNVLNEHLQEARRLILKVQKHIIHLPGINTNTPPWEQE